MYLAWKHFRLQFSAVWMRARTRLRTTLDAMCAHRTNLAERTAASSLHMTVFKSHIARRSPMATCLRSRVVMWASSRLRNAPMWRWLPLVRRAPNFAKYIIKIFLNRFLRLNILNWLSELFWTKSKDGLFNDLGTDRLMYWLVYEQYVLGFGRVLLQ